VLTFEFNQGLLYQQEGRFGDALEKFNSLLANHAEKFDQPDLRFMYEDVQQRRAFLLVTLGRFEDAVPVFKEILSFELDKSVRSDALARVGLCYLELQRWELSKGYFLQALAIGLTSEEEKQFHFYLGIAYFHTDSLLDAKREFLLCEKHAGEYEVPILDVYAWLSSTCKRLGELEEAERYARLAHLT
jgi:tetratricopeptide (TPR) repeat protein